jgi:hypothetical protein
VNLAEIAELVDRGLALRRTVAAKTKELDLVEDQLRDVGLEMPHVLLVDEERGGRRWLAAGSRFVVPVIFTADKLIGSFKDKSPMHEKVAGASNGHLARFYVLERTFETRFKDGKDFRKEADTLLGKSAASFVSVCTQRDKDGVGKSDIKVQWAQAEARESDQ